MKPAPLVVEMNKLIKAYADEQGLEYVDYYTSLADENGALKEGLSKDRCHPYPDVYFGMEEKVVAAIDKAAKKCKKKKNRK